VRIWIKSENYVLFERQWRLKVRIWIKSENALLFERQWRLKVRIWIKSENNVLLRETVEIKSETSFYRSMCTNLVDPPSYEKEGWLTMKRDTPMETQRVTHRGSMGRPTASPSRSQGEGGVNAGLT
jgi:hypothetical protein